MSLFHFLRPWWLLAIIPSILFLIVLLKSRSSTTIWKKHCDSHLLPHLLVGQSSKVKSTALPSALFLLWTVGIFAISGPTWSHYPQPVFQKEQARVIALDVSQSMNTKDIKPTRLDRARFKILDMLKAIKEGQTGMVVFSSMPFVVTPLTSDSHTIANLVPALNSQVVPVQGQSIKRALIESAQLIKQAGFDKGDIILVTDSSPTQSGIFEAKKLADQGVKVNILVTGTAKGAPLVDSSGNYVTDQSGSIVFSKVNIPALQSLAKAGGG